MAGIPVDKIAPHAPAHTKRVDHTPCNSTPEERNALSDLGLRLHAAAGLLRRVRDSGSTLCWLRVREKRKR